MKVFYDCEFTKTAPVIDLVSLAMVAEDGRKLYAISCEFSLAELDRNRWLAENVAPSLPLKYAKDGGPWDQDHPDFLCVRSRSGIAKLVRSFVQETPDVQLWADHGAYDHVALCQLFGPMADLPEGFPMWTRDLQQALETHGFTEADLPQQKSGHHNALEDARHLRDQMRVLDALITAAAK